MVSGLFQETDCSTIICVKSCLFIFIFIFQVQQNVPWDPWISKQDQGPGPKRSLQSGSQRKIDGEIVSKICRGKRKCIGQNICHPLQKVIVHKRLQDILSTGIEPIHTGVCLHDLHALILVY